MKLIYAVSSNVNTESNQAVFHLPLTFSMKKLDM